MNIVLWVLQILLGLMFLAAGAMKATQSKEQLVASGGERMAWTEDISASNIRLIGILELLGGLGLILPWLTGILRFLTPLAASGLVLTMIGALLLHVRRGDGPQAFVTNIVLGLLAAFVAYGRLFLVA